MNIIQIFLIAIALVLSHLSVYCLGRVHAYGDARKIAKRFEYDFKKIGDNLGKKSGEKK